MESQPSSSGAGNSDYESAFEQTGYGGFNKLATLSCSLIFIHSLIEMVAIAYVITPAECDLRLTVGQKSMINSAVFIGIMVTAIFWGVAGDQIGRRKIMLPAVLATCATSFASSLCTKFWMMFLLRLLTGFLVSASSAMVLVYLAELQDSAHRDRSISIAISAAQFSFVLIPGVAWTIIPRQFSLSLGPMTIRPWRVFMWLWGLIGLSGAAILFMLPESPSFILSAKGPTKAIPILAKIYAWNFKSTADKYPIKNIDSPSSGETKPGILKDLSAMMKPPIRRCVFLTHGAMFATFLLTNGLYIWLPDFVNAALARSSEAINMCMLISQKYISQSDSNISVFIHELPIKPPEEDSCSADLNWVMYPMSMGMEFFYLIPFLTVIIIINKYSKVWLYAIIMWICSIGVLVSSLMPQCMVAMAFMVVGLACGSCCCLLTALAVDAFPTSLRGLATCTMYMSGQLGAVVGTSLIGLMAGFMCYVIFVIVACVTAGAAFALVMYWPNTAEVRKQMEAKNFSY